MDEEICYHKPVANQDLNKTGEKMYEKNKKIQCYKCSGTKEDAERLKCDKFINEKTEKKDHEREEIPRW